MVTRKTLKPAIRRAPAKRALKTPRNIWRELSEIGKPIPSAERRALPRDGAKNVDYCLDGSSKED